MFGDIENLVLYSLTLPFKHAHWSTDDTSSQTKLYATVNIDLPKPWNNRKHSRNVCIVESQLCSDLVDMDRSGPALPRDVIEPPLFREPRPSRYRAVAVWGGSRSSRAARPHDLTRAVAAARQNRDYRNQYRQPSELSRQYHRTTARRYR